MPHRGSDVVGEHRCTHSYLCSRVEDWRGNPQDSPCLYPGFPLLCPCRVVRDPVSNPRHFARSVRISRTPRSCTFRVKGYGAYQTRAAFGTGRLLHRFQRKSRLKAPGSFSLRLDVDPPSQILQIYGRLYHHTPASRVDEEVTCSKVPLLHGGYPASSLLRTQPPPSRLRPTSRCLRLYGLPCSIDFAMGRGRLLQLHSMSLSPRYPYHPAGVTCPPKLDTLPSIYSSALIFKETKSPTILAGLHVNCDVGVRSESRLVLAPRARLTASTEQRNS